LDGFSRGANRDAVTDACQPIEFCDACSQCWKFLSRPRNRLCIQLEGGFICLCKPHDDGGPNSSEGCVLTPSNSDNMNHLLLDDIALHKS
jgi:hypothetical protein